MDPNRTALLVYDMQVVIVPFVEERERVKQTVSRLIAGAHKSGVPVFYSRHYKLPLKTVVPAQLRSAMRFQHATWARTSRVERKTSLRIARMARSRRQCAVTYF